MVQKPNIAIVWRGPPADRGKSLPETSRLAPVVRSLQMQGFETEGVVWCEEAAEEFRAQLLSFKGALVWVDPLTGDRDRSLLDPILRSAADKGVWIGSHPDTILKIGTKQVLYDTRAVGWSSDVVLYRTYDEFTRDFPSRLKASGTRVLKRYRGNGGQGVWKVVLKGDGETVRLQEATNREGKAEELPLVSFIERCSAYFVGEGRLIDQAFQPRIVDGIVRCYMVANALVGFSRQYPPGYGTPITPEETFGLPAAKTMYPPDAAEFASLKTSLEREWVPHMQRVLDIGDAALPALWDADSLFGPKDKAGWDSYVLCEINASCVSPFPPEAPAKIAAHVGQALANLR
jgi:hypothetical protein